MISVWVHRVKSGSVSLARKSSVPEVSSASVRISEFATGKSLIQVIESETGEILDIPHDPSVTEYSNESVPQKSVFGVYSSAPPVAMIDPLIGAVVTVRVSSDRL